MASRPGAGKGRAQKAQAAHDDEEILAGPFASGVGTDNRKHSGMKTKIKSDGSSLPVLEVRRESDAAGSEENEGTGRRASDGGDEDDERPEAQLAEPGEEDEYDDVGLDGQSSATTGTLSESGSESSLISFPMPSSKPPSIPPPASPGAMIPIKRTASKLKRAETDLPTASPSEATDDGEADDSSIGASGKVKRKKKSSTGENGSGSGSAPGSPGRTKGTAAGTRRGSKKLVSAKDSNGSSEGIDISSSPLPPELPNGTHNGDSNRVSPAPPGLPAPLPLPPPIGGTPSPPPGPPRTPLPSLPPPGRASPGSPEEARKDSVSSEGEDDAPPPRLNSVHAELLDRVNLGRRTSLIVDGMSTLRDSLENSDDTGSGNRRKPLKRRPSSRSASTSTIKRKPITPSSARPHMMDNVIRIVKSMYENRDSVDPRIFLIEAKEYPENVIYVDENEEATEDYNLDYPAIKAATVEKLILGLTPEGYSDPDFNFAFLLSYKAFATAQTLIDLLKARWTIPFPQVPSKTGVTVDLETFNKKKLTPIRLRIINVIKLWLDEHRQGLDADSRNIIEKYIVEVIKPDMAGPAASLLRLVQAAKEGKEEPVMFDEKPPKPYLPMNIKSTLSILDVHPEEIARQMTLIDSSFYRRIKPGEFLHSGWTKSDKEQRSPGILAMINSFNVISRWISTQILLQPDLKQRAITLNRVICIAQHCYEYNNFNGVMEVIASLHNSSIHRLYNTWEMLPQKAVDMFAALSDLMNSNAGEGNFFLYRNALKKVVPPLVPYLGVYLTDLIFLNDGNKDFVDEDKKLVNFHKMAKIARVVRTIYTHQQSPYCLTPVEFIQDFIQKSTLFTDDQQYVESCKLEKKVPKSQRQAAPASKPAKKIKVDFKALGIHFEDD